MLDNKKSIELYAVIIQNRKGETLSNESRIQEISPDENWMKKRCEFLNRTVFGLEHYFAKVNVSVQNETLKKITQEDLTFEGLEIIPEIEYYEV